MGTKNFNNNRSSKVYAVETSFYDDQIDESVYDEFIYDDTRDNIVYELKSICKEVKEVEFYEDDNISLDEVLRSYPATSLGSFYTYYNYLNLDIEIELIPKTVAGYYEGFNLDYEINIKYNGISYDKIEDLFNDILYYEDKIYHALLKKHGKKFITGLKYKIEYMIIILESVFLMYSSPLNYLGSFSNGEAIYKKAG